MLIPLYCLTNSLNFIKIDLQDIIESYQAKYESSLLEDISSDVSGDYRLILQRIFLGTPEESADEAAAEGAIGGDEDAAAEDE